MRRRDREAGEAYAKLSRALVTSVEAEEVGQPPTAAEVEELRRLAEESRKTAEAAGLTHDPDQLARLADQTSPGWRRR